MSQENVDIFRYAYEMGYGYGRLDQLEGNPYDDRTPLQKKRENESNEEATSDDV